jgi:hypothetical protein
MNLTAVVVSWPLPLRNPLVLAVGREEAVRSVFSTVKHVRYILGSLSAVIFTAAASSTV